MIGHLLYSYHHLDDARIQQEISKQLYAPVFGGTYLVHSHNGSRSFGYRPYLEDKLLRLKNRGHFQGACDLVNAGVKHFISLHQPHIKYVLVTAADTWCLNATFLKHLLKEMEQNKKVLTVASWSRNQSPNKISGFSTDFFIINLDWAKRTKIFPLQYAQFRKKFKDLFTVLWQMPNVEMCFQFQYSKYFMTHYKDNDIWRTRDALLRRLEEREPIHRNGIRRFDWPRLGLFTNPYPKSKQQALRKMHVNLGPFSRKLIRATNLNYYNKVV